MSAVLMPGAPVAERVLADLEPRIKVLLAGGHAVGLGTILVGSDGASAGYVRMKQEKATSFGMAAPHVHLGDDAAQDEVLEAIDRMNDDDAVTGFLLQHPTPRQIDFDAALLAIDPAKDVDGLHPENVGRLALGMPGPVSCTPAGIEALLAHYEIPLAGRGVCILGRGTTLGRPLALLLSQKRPTANAAVTVVHTGVLDWPEYTKRAEIVIAAAGVPGILQPEHLTPWWAGACATRAASSCPTSMRPARRWPAGSRRVWAGWAPPPSPCSSATAWRQPSAAPGWPDAGPAHRAARGGHRRPPVVRPRLARPPDAGDDPSSRRPAPGRLGRHGTS
jgi:methylenetetrahydrofolate dehydrogenase (NADP+) / methenyltetrahydrofolate cyclohydrolase